MSDQPALFEPPKPPKRGPGRHETMVRDALAAAEDKDMLRSTDGALVSLAIANGWALDEAEDAGQPYAVAQLTAPFLELLVKLGLVPDGGESTDDALAAALADLNRVDE